MGHPFLRDVTLRYWVFGFRPFETTQWSHLQEPKCPRKWKTIPTYSRIHLFSGILVGHIGP
jgi:hypothetical protein